MQGRDLKLGTAVVPLSETSPLASPMKIYPDLTFTAFGEKFSISYMFSKDFRNSATKFCPNFIGNKYASDHGKILSIPECNLQVWAHELKARSLSSTNLRDTNLDSGDSQESQPIQTGGTKTGQGASEDEE